MSESSVLIVNAGVKSRLGLKHGKPIMPPGAINEIGAMIPDRKCIAWDENAQGAVPGELFKQTQLVLVTSLTPSIYRAIDIVRLAKESNCQVVVGGRHAIGLGRQSGGKQELNDLFPSVCTSCLNPALMDQILCDANRHQLEPFYELKPEDSVEMILPRRDLLDPNHYLFGCPVRSSSGCNRSCPWCTVGGQGFLMKDLSILEQELQMIRSFGTHVFVDAADSFAGNIEFAREVISLYARSHMKWVTEITVEDVLKNNLIEPMAKAGCGGLYFGIENIKKIPGSKSNQKMAEEAIKLCRKHGIIVIGSLILDPRGDETIPDIRENIAWATQWLDLAQFSLVALLPGCGSYQSALKNNQIIDPNCVNWEKYDGAYQTRKHQNIPLGQLEGLLQEAYIEFANWQAIFNRVRRAPRIITKLEILALGYQHRQIGKAYRKTVRGY